MGRKVTFGGVLPATGIPLRAGAEVVRYWPLLVLALLVPIWSIGLFGRGIWSPDEPREYDIAYNMLQSGDLVVPQLAGAPFLEKPPLAYWAASASMRLFGPSITAARLPNLLWAALAVLSIGALAGDAAGERNRHQAALIAALACGTFGLVLQVQIWLATDAPLLGMTAVALLSAWRLAHAATLRQRLGWSVLLGVALAGAALAKNGFGLLVPVLTIVTWLAWERRLRELLRWPWWAAAGGCALLIGVWLIALAHRRGGSEMLRALLWDNLVARFLPVQSGAAYDLGHKSSHWKFLLLPVYALPWTFAVVGAGRWSAHASGNVTKSTSAVRYCIASVVPACVVLLLSGTARDVYFAPSLLCVPVLLALWLTMRLGAFAGFERTALRLTRHTFLAFAILFAGAAALLLGAIGIHSISAVAIVVVIAFVLVGTALSPRWNADPAHGLATAAGLFLAALAALELVAFQIIDRTENLDALFATAGPQLSKARVAVYCSDETTRATLDYVLGLRPPQICAREGAQQLLQEHEDQQFLVLLARPRSAQSMSELFPGVQMPASKSKHRRIPQRVSDLVSLGLQRVACWSVPGGRKYALYGRSPTLQQHTAIAPCQAVD